MATGSKFQPFVLALAKGLHDFSSDTLKVALVAAANLPVGTEDGLADLTEISYTNCSSRTLTITSATQVDGKFYLILADLTISASGGAVGPFQGVIIYNDTAANKDLICYWNLGSEVTLADTQSMLLDFNNVDGAITLE